MSIFHDETAGSNQREQDNLALQLRSRGQSYGSIAKHLGLDHTWLAVAGFNRALRRQAPLEQDRLRQQESERLSRLTTSVQHNEALDDATRRRRLDAVERLRVALFSTSGEITERSRRD